VKLCPVMFRSAVVAVDPETGRAKVEDWLQCQGSRCAWWAPYTDEETGSPLGRCAQALCVKGWPDPAGAA